MSNAAARYIYGDAEPAHRVLGPDWWSASNNPTGDQSSVQQRPKFSGIVVNTLLSETQLNKRGLLLHPHETETWLIDIDADTLTGDQPCEAWYAALVRRLGELRDLANEEEIPFSEVSAGFALQFSRNMTSSVRPGAFLLGNGNIRLLWNRGREQIGLQFLEDGLVQFVLFADRGDRVATLMGDDGLDDILRHVTSAGLRHLLND